MMLTAIEFGERFKSCEPAMQWRRSLPPGTMQAEAYQLCDRGDWLLWQLTRPGVVQLQPEIDRIVERIVARAIRRAQQALYGIRANWATKWRRWARCWLSGEDRSEAAAAEAAVAADAITIAEAAEAVTASETAVWAAIWLTKAAWITEIRGASEAAAWAAAEQTADVEMMELRRQAREIHRLIPVWPGMIGEE
jgi:hypothetical protein